jgi:hypothetical protein
MTGWTRLNSRWGCIFFSLPLLQHPFVVHPASYVMSIGVERSLFKSKYSHPQTYDVSSTLVPHTLRFLPDTIQEGKRANSLLRGRWCLGDAEFLRSTTLLKSWSKAPLKKLRNLRLRRGPWQFQSLLTEGGVRISWHSDSKKQRAAAANMES